MAVTPLLCVTVTAPSMAELRRSRDTVTGADLIELRLDTVADPDVAGALADRKTPVIVTCRPTWEGGQFSGSEDERLRILEQAWTLGAEYVDVEWRAGCAPLLERSKGRRVIVSVHDFNGVPSDLTATARAMQSSGADVIKIAVKANRLSDCLPLLALGADLTRGANDGAAAGRSSAPQPVLVAMGERGLPSRVLAGRFRSAWTYAGALTDIGQVTPAALIESYRFKSLGDSTAVYGLVGSPVAHSVSPVMHNAAFAAARLDAVYLPLDAADADDFVTFARGIGLAGASVTIPFKVSLYERVDEAYAVARRIGALNTIRVVDGRWLGGNTDASGFLQPLQERLVSMSGMRAAILGAGGAARAVAIALAPSGVDVSVHARTRDRAEQVAMIVSGRVGPWPPEPGSWDLLINCTPIGMHPHVDETPLSAELLTGRIVYDLVYNPPETRLLREATRAGCLAIGGLDMLIAQAHEQFQWWTDVRPPTGVMRAAALKRLSEFPSHEHYVV